MRKIILVLLFSHVVFAMEQQEIKFTISGDAPHALYTCDFFGVFDCWYANLKASCELAFNPRNVQVINENTFSVSGARAVRIIRLTTTCMSNHYLDGITCGYDHHLGFHCSLTVDDTSTIAEMLSRSTLD